MTPEERNNYATELFTATKDNLLAKTGFDKGVGFLIAVFQDNGIEVSMDISHGCSPAHVCAMTLDLLNDPRFESAIYHAVAIKAKEREAEQSQNVGHA